MSDVREQKLERLRRAVMRLTYAQQETLGTSSRALGYPSKDLTDEFTRMLEASERLERGPRTSVDVGDHSYYVGFNDEGGP